MRAEGLERSDGLQWVLHNFDVELEVVTAAPQSPAARVIATAIERRGQGRLLHHSDQSPRR
jgi:hypothetical protein